MISTCPGFVYPVHPVEKYVTGIPNGIGEIVFSKNNATDTIALPPIDLSVPENLQTATFALG